MSDDIFRRRVDWSCILDSLRDAGWSGYRVANALGRKWDTVQGWRTGEPKHADGEALLILFREHCSTVNIPYSPDTCERV